MAYKQLALLLVLAVLFAPVTDAARVKRHAKHKVEELEELEESDNSSALKRINSSVNLSEVTEQEEDPDDIDGEVAKLEKKMAELKAKKAAKEAADKQKAAGEIPMGRYTDSCNGCKVLDGLALFCKGCMSKSGKEVPAAAPLSLCSAFSNKDGRLQCVEGCGEGTPGYPSTDALPEGPYKEECENCRVEDGQEGKVLACDCNSRDEFNPRGGGRHSKINLCACSSFATDCRPGRKNCRGMFQCESGEQRGLED
eukprot:gnl/MRDRNA2_/MRDRNA2_81131_c0_seq1.p1 gnl/MRDRNA2_/MRDRNA2_81131_c0~~gnl/MRDRNA2_/MRDRNA2_81131_c0_seq1.p1  ORF type:complete len:254 (-),score=58.45 gnl/MRDRNA2_/MRDRNA2_81131_c0_seq1:175-936(-)